jgi:hypothetical protein
MNFQDALTAMQNGKRLTRKCWNEKGKYVTQFHRPENYQGYKQDRVFYVRVAMNIGHYTHMDVVWNPTTGAILDTNWEIVE